MSRSRLKERLTRQQQQFYKEKTMSNTMKIKDWIGFMGIVAELDKKGDRTIKNLSDYITACVVLAVILFFATIISQYFQLLIGIPVLIFLGIVIYISKKRLENEDLNNYMRSFFLPVLHILKDKAGEKAKLSAKVDFRNPRKAAKPQKSKVNGRSQSLYMPTYITARIAFKDKVLFGFMLKEDIKDLTWTKRNYNGKVKRKSKTKLVHHCMFNFSFPKSEYLWLGNKKENCFITTEEDRYIVKSRIKIKKLGDHHWHVKDFIEEIKTIYALFKPLNHVTEEYEANVHEGEEEIILAPYVWYGGYFDRYDYDSFDHTHYEHEAYEESGASVFDS